jgi:YesN/AraC family two-component response regulator
MERTKLWTIKKKTSFPKYTNPNGDCPRSIYSTTRKSILIVGEVENISGDYRTLLRKNFKLYCAESGISAISLIERLRSIDILLLEHSLPDRAWTEVLKAYRNTWPTAPAIVITANSSEETAIMALQCGATDYIKTPCSTKELIARINRSLTPFKSRKVSGLVEDSVSRSCALTCSENFQRTIYFINENYTSNLTLSQAADMACLSYHHFSKVFKKNLGVGFRAYINKKRIDKARKMLAYSNMTVTYIAHSVGFEDLTNFERVFRGLTAYTPSEYRNKKLRDSTSTKKVD